MYKVNGESGTLHVSCQIVNHGVNYHKRIEASYSSGVPYSIFPCDHIESSFTKETLAEADRKMFTLPNSDNTTIELFALDVLSFVIGKDIVLGNQRIWVSFDEAITDSVIGYDILSQVSRPSIAGEGYELFFNSATELSEYVEANL